MSSLVHSLLTLFAGGLLALMLYFNGMLAKYIQPFEASLIIHLIGLVAALGLLAFWRNPNSFKFNRTSKTSLSTGVFGGIAVVLVGIAVNGPIGVAGTVGLIVLGQVIYGWVNDTMGLFGTPRRRLNKLDLLQATLILLGVGVLIYG